MRWPVAEKTRTIRFTVEVTALDEADPDMVADDLLAYLCDGGDGIVAYPDGIFSVDNVEWRHG